MWLSDVQIYLVKTTFQHLNLWEAVKCRGPVMNVSKRAKVDAAASLQSGVS